jgi:hypothetical protein
MNEYDPNAKECKQRNDAWLLTAAMNIDLVDSAKFRIRDAKECKQRNDARMLTAAMYISNVDTAKFRIRAVENGRVAIKALEQAIERRRKSGLDVDKYDLYSVFLDQLKGQAIKDGLIKETLEKQHNIKMSEAELTKFTNFLISFDPAYPSWTKVFVWAEMTKEESDRYHQAYQKFKKKR